MTRRRVWGTVLVAVFALVSPRLSNQADSSIALQNSAPLTRLNVTECHDFGSKGLLQCKQEGFFVQSFAEIAREFGWKAAGNEQQCCRPALPNQEIWSGRFGKDVPLAVMSVGCHLAANDADAHLTCTGTPDSLAIGFGDYANTRGHKTRIPPGVLCCLPVLLMASGDAYQLRRCNCLPEKHGLKCSPGKLLQGFDHSELIQERDVPKTPPSCCDVCLGEDFYGVNQCDHLNGCNGNGICIHGTCKCFPDWIGEECDTIKDTYLEPPKLEASVWWLGGLGFIGAFFCLFATFWIIRRAEQEGPRTASDRGLLGLLNTYINDTGSVGSVDTESVRSHAGDDSDCRNAAPTGGGDDCEEMKTSLAEDSAYRPLLQMTCCLCESHPVQVTLIPCGHSNLCRKCSRKLTTCPFCRKTIVRRQRLFLSV